MITETRTRTDFWPHLKAALTARGGTRQDRCLTGVFATGLIVFVVYVLHQYRSTFFWLDDWNLMIKYHDGNPLDPFNGHLVLVSALLYRSVLQVWGPNFRVFVAIGILSFAAFGASTFWYSRKRYGASIAAIFSLWLLWYSANAIEVLLPVFHTYTIPLALTFVILARLDSQLADPLTLALLVIAMATSAVGLFAFVVALSHLILVKAPARRMLLFTAPAAVWFVWYMFKRESRGDIRNLIASVTYIDELIRSTFVGLGGGSRLVGFVLGIAFVLLFAVTHHRRGSVDPHVLRWIIVAIVFAIVMSLSAENTAPGNAVPGRYSMVMSIFILLAAAESLRRLNRPPISLITLMLLVVIFGATKLVSDLRVHHKFLAAARQSYAPMLLGVEAAGSKAEGDRDMDIFASDPVYAGDYLDLVESVGSVAAQVESGPFMPESAQVADRILTNEVGLDAIPGSCDLTGRVSAARVLADPGSTVSLVSIGPDARVRLSRFAAEDAGGTRLTTLKSGESTLIMFPVDNVAIPWLVSTDPGVLVTLC